MITARQIRREFIEFFESRGHAFVPSSPVVPHDDPTLLFTNAGMNQFKKIFLGTEVRDYSRAANSQKCIRVSGKHNDLEEVGLDTYHHTFFEMLGNWSFGDYYKAEAIEWAWELLVGSWGLPPEDLYATVFEDDDEAEELWLRLTPLPRARVLRFGKKDNFWEMGETGPCGPCSEIHIDLGPAGCDRQGVEGHVCAVNGDCGRYIELWNLVFIQYNRTGPDSLAELEAKHVDTGMGLERITAVLQGAASNYDTDLFSPIIRRVEDLAGTGYAESDEKPAFRVIADHIRALTAAIADGAMPSNEGRGYVLRRILRRAARYGRKIGLSEPFLYKLTSAVADILGRAFPEIEERADHAAQVIKAEESSFGQTLDRGLELFDKLAAQLESDGDKTVPGDEAFKLYDTYGFPLDLTQLMARERGLGVDAAGFERELKGQQKRSRAAGKFAAQEVEQVDWTRISGGPDSEFVGYEALECEAEIRRAARRDHGVHLVLSRTPFYGESGGQAGDTGVIEGVGFRFEISKTYRDGEAIVHVGTGAGLGDIKDPKVTARVHSSPRWDTMRNHTATHLLQAALRSALGGHVNQSGSLVEPDHLRFDFTHYHALTPEELDRVEAEVNRMVREDRAVTAEVKGFDQAKAEGATALFGEKYGDEVRVVAVEDCSRELCGGTHVWRTGQIGAFRIVSEGSVAAGIRRIEAVTGRGAVELIQAEKGILRQARELLNATGDEVPDRIRAALADRKRLEKELEKARKFSASVDVDSMLNKAREVGGVKLIVERLDELDVNALKNLADGIREKGRGAVALLATVQDGKAGLVCAVTDDLIKDRGLKAGDLVGLAARAAGGGGGGKPHLATAGAKSTELLDAALNEFPARLEALLQ